MIERLSYVPDQAQEKKLVYNPSFDERDYKNFGLLSSDEQNRLKAYTKRQFETYLGERVGVILSITRFEIADGKMIPQGVNEPMEDIIERGVNYRRSLKNPNVIDFEREAAELEGAKKTQARLTDKDTKVGAKNVSISPKGGEGSDYTNDFFDVYTLKEDQSGRYVEMSRYLSSLTTDQYQKKLEPFKVFDKTPTAVDFLREPIEMDGFETPDDIQKYLNQGIKALEAEKLEQIKQIVAPFTASYINSLIDNPYDFFTHRLNYNGVLNQTDIVLAAVVNNDRALTMALYHAAAFSSPEAIEARMQILGKQKVRVAGGPCPGISGGVNLGGIAKEVKDPYSVIQYGSKEDKYGSLEFPCPHKGCEKINTRQPNQLISNCQHCGKNVRC